MNIAPKEKAIELVSKFSIYSNQFHDNDIRDAKECALILVYELIKQNAELYLNGLHSVYSVEKNNFLFEVKKEIELL